MTRAEMEWLAVEYLAALVASDPSRLPLASNVVFAENDQPIPLGTAGWKTIDSVGRYRHVVCDLETQNVGFIANVAEGGLGAVLIVRLGLRDGQIAEIEQYVVRDPGAYDRYEELGAPEPIWFEPIPQVARQSREALEAVAWMYFQTLERNDGAGIYPFTPDCSRLELGRQSVARATNESYGHADSAVEFTTLKAREQYALGMMGYINRVRDRRVLAIDPERGTVLASALFDMDGMTQKIDFAKGGVFEVPAYFRTPRTHHMNEAFKVVNGSFRYVEMTFLEVPYGTRPVWNKVPSATRTDVRHAPVPIPITSVDRAGLLQLVESFLGALVRCCPCELPLAESCVYTENGVRVELGDGLWKSVSGLRSYRVSLADPQTGQAAVLCALDENGYFLVLAARLKVAAGLITEVETITARPERTEEWGNLGHATHTLFVPPLLVDLHPSGFAALDARLTAAPRRPTSRAALANAVTTMSLSSDSVRRENGVRGDCPDYAAAAGETSLRNWLIDAELGLVLNLAFVDIAGTVTTPAAFRTPSTDLHAQLIKVDGGEILMIEDIVRRVPYGLRSPWDR
jgi:hypothetical protein